MKLSKIAGTAAVLILGMSLPAYGQKDEKEQAQPHAQPAQQAKPQQQRAAPQSQQRAQPQQAKAPAQQPQQRAQQAKAPAAQPQQRAQQAKAPAQQPQQRVQQAKSPAQQPQERAQQAKPSPMAQQQQHAQPAARQEARTPQPQAKPAVAARVQAPQAQRTPKQAQSWQQQRGWDKQGGGWQPHTNFQQGRDQNWASDHRDWAQRGGYGGSYIPQATFGLYFGSAHFFRIGVMPVMYMGYPRFAYGGFSFMLLDPWPGSWQENWYSSDDVYIDYSDGYYLHDRRYPGISLAVSVAL